jgi:hypothetical protein
MTALGRSFAQVDAMTLYEAQIIFDYWAEMPPANEILAAVYSVEKPKQRPLNVDDVRNMAVEEGYMTIDELRDSFKKAGGLRLVTDNGS